MIRSVSPNSAAQPILHDLEACAAMNQEALASHDASVATEPPNFGRLIWSFVQYGMVHSSLAHLRLPDDSGVDTRALQSGLLHNRATVLRDMGSYRQAASLFEEVVALQKEMNDPRRIDTLINVSALHLKTGTIMAAREAALQAVALSANLQAQCRALPADDASAEAMVQLSAHKLLSALNRLYDVGYAHAAQLETVDRRRAADVRMAVAEMFDNFLGAAHQESLTVRADVTLANTMMFNKPDNTEPRDSVERASDALALMDMDGATQGAVAGRLSV